MDVASRFGEYLEANHLISKGISFQLCRTHAGYQLRFPVKKGLDQNEEYIANCKLFARQHILMWPVLRAS